MRLWNPFVGMTFQTPYLGKRWPGGPRLHAKAFLEESRLKWVLQGEGGVFSAVTGGGAFQVDRTAV